MSVDKTFALLEAYMEKRGVFPKMDVAAFMLNLERFLIPKPEFVNGIEYVTLFQPSSPSFNSLIIADSIMHQPFTASHALTKVVAEHYGLTHTEPVVRNESPNFHLLTDLATLTEMGIDDGSKYMEIYRKSFGDKGFSDLYPSGAAIQAAAAEGERKLGQERARELISTTLLDRFNGLVDQGFDFIHFYNPFREQDVNKRASTLFGLISLLKTGGVLVMEHCPIMYGKSDKVKGTLADRGIRPAYEGSPLDLPFLGVLSSVDVYVSPRRG